MTGVTPISGLAQRMPVVGTLRNGATKGSRPVSLNKWRLTTSSLPFATAFADRYGGEVKPWDGNPGQHEVFSDATEVAIALLPDGFDISYQLWSAGGMQRKCDGVTCEVLQTTGPDNVEYVENPCVCDRKGVLECGLRSRLTFVLPDLPFGGGVAYKTGSKNFAEEAQGMLRLIQQLQAQGINRGYLRLEQRKSTGNRKYTIATVGVSESLEALASGAAGMGSLGRASDTQLASVESPAIEAPRGGEAPPSSPPHPSSSGVGAEGEAASAPEEPTVEQASDTLEDIVDAEIVDEGPSGFTLDPAERARMRSAFMARTKTELGLDYESQTRVWMEHKYGGGWSSLSDEEASNLYHALFVPDGTREQKEQRGQQFKTTVLEHLETLS